MTIKRPRPGLDDRVDVGAGDVRRIEDVLGDRGVHGAHALGRRPLQLVVLDEDGAAGSELRRDRGRLRGAEPERRLDDRADRDAGQRRERRPRQSVGPLHLDEPAGLEIAAVRPLAGDAGGEELLGARLSVERREVDRYALSLDLDHACPHPLRPVRQAHRLEDRERLAPGRRPDFENRAHRRIVGPMTVKLHRCSGMWAKFDGHPCWRVQKALDEAGVEYELVKEGLGVQEARAASRRSRRQARGSSRGSSSRTEASTARNRRRWPRRSGPGSWAKPGNPPSYTEPPRGYSSAGRAPGSRVERTG